MITLKAFVGTLLEEVTRARAASDQASMRLAQQYLDTELLKGFPVPRMQIRDMEIELNFAVASKQGRASFLEDERVQKNIGYQIRDFMSELPSREEFKPYFGDNLEIVDKWKSGLDDLAGRFSEILSKPASDPQSVINNLSLTAENYFYELAPDQMRFQISTILERRFQPKKSSGAGTIKAAVQKEITAIIAAMDKRMKEGVPDDSPDLNLLLGASELEKLNPSLLHKVKISISSSDRRWVVTDQNGEKVAILDRN
jgi:hypothetical protein